MAEKGRVTSFALKLPHNFVNVAKCLTTAPHIVNRQSEGKSQRKVSLWQYLMNFLLSIQPFDL